MSMREGFRRRHVMSGAFVFLLLGIFAVFSTMMVLLSAQLYRGTVENTRLHSGKRVAESYLMNVVRGNDQAGVVSVKEIDGLSVLVFAWDAGDEVYEMKIYCHNGVLRELFTEAAEEFEPEYGEKICEIAAFEPAIEGNLLCMRLCFDEGAEKTLYSALRCGEVAS